MIRLYPVTPVPAPRQVQKDKWNPSDNVVRYRMFRDELKLRQIWIPPDFHHVVFVMPMLASWSGKKAADIEGAPHQRTPDRDNLEKALLDSVFGQDCAIWNGQTTKVWGRCGMIIVADHPIPIERGRLLTPAVYGGFTQCGLLRLPSVVLPPHAFG